MANAEAAWLLAPLALMLGGLLIFRRYRRRNGALAESQAFKARMPRWAANLERLLLLLSMVIISAMLFWLLHLFEKAFDIHRPSEEFASILAVLGVFLIALPLAMLLSNWISWSVPPLREANLQAMTGSKLSFREVGVGLGKFALFTTSFGLALFWISLARAWVH